MINFARKVISTYRNYGLREFLSRAGQFIYGQFLIDRLPRRVANFNGVKAPGGRLLDSVVPWREVDHPLYESGLVSAIETYVREGESVVIVGGGLGVTAVTAGKTVGTNGCVTVFEASHDSVGLVRRTIDLNDIENVEVKHAIVGPAIEVYGPAGNAATVPPQDLPNCDVLELDCEGAEIEILELMVIRPRIILVETHGLHGASTDRVKQTLNDLSYGVVLNEIAEKRNPQFFLDNDIRVLVAVDKL